jgi:hypothetical protein
MMTSLRLAFGKRLGSLTDVERCKGVQRDLNNDVVERDEIGDSRWPVHTVHTHQDDSGIGIRIPELISFLQGVQN